MADGEVIMLCEICSKRKEIIPKINVLKRVRGHGYIKESHKLACTNCRKNLSFKTRGIVDKIKGVLD